LTVFGACRDAWAKAGQQCIGASVRQEKALLPILHQRRHQRLEQGICDEYPALPQHRTGQPQQLQCVRHASGAAKI